MIVDAQWLSHGRVIEADLCVIGAGAAGITVTREFIGKSIRVCLLEAGGLRYEQDTQSLYEGETTSIDFSLRQTRLAAFGGSTGVWAGMCRPLDAIDFEPREWVPASGWAFGRAELDPYYVRAHAVCGLGACDYDPSKWETALGMRRLPVGAEWVATSIFHVSPIRFGRAYCRELARAANLEVLLHAHAVELITAAAGDRVERVRVATLGGLRFDVIARLFVLAAGGIENARLLLLSGAEAEGGLGNSHGLVGRFFTEHGFINTGWFIPADPARAIDFYFPCTARVGGRFCTVRGAFSLAPGVLRRERLLNCAMFFRPRSHAHAAFDSPGVGALLDLWEQWRGRAVPGPALKHFQAILRDIDRVAVAVLYKLLACKGGQPRLSLRTFFECAPNAESRVTLAPEKDVLGRRRARVDWRLNDIDIRSVKRAHELLDAALRDARLGRLKVALGEEPARWFAAVETGKHQMGTTRMHSDPAQGVVDAQCRVYGVENLYVAGSSIFPTVGYANPTLTIVALALRLADHLKHSLKAVG
jgi:choline dehydrogenase-like flavoprotein